MSDAAANVDLDDIQGLLRFGYGRHTEACFLLLRVTDSDAARRWLAGAPVASAATLAEPPPLLLQVALSNEGLRALQVPDAVIGRFSTEFVAGMSGNTSRERRLGDIGGNDPGSWVWGSNKRRTPIPRLPLRPPDDYLRLAMVNALAEGDVELELRLQLQTDPHPLPIENAGVLWPEGFHRVCRWQRCEFRGRPSIRQRNSISPSGFRTTPGTASPSIARLATRAARAAACTTSCRSCATR